MPAIKTIPKTDLDVFVEIMADAYPGLKIDKPEERRRVVARMTRRFEDPRLRPIGLYEGTDMVGAMALWDFTINLFGDSALAGGGGMLGVRLVDKKKQVAKRLVQYYFNHYRRRRSPLAVLWPFRHDFYRRMGAGYGAPAYLYEFAPGHLPRPQRLENVRNLTDGDIEAVRQCYNRWVRNTHGAIEEPREGWHISNELNTPKRVGYVENDRILGYLSYRFAANDPSDFLNNSLEVQDLIYETPKALQQLLGFLAVQLDQFRTIRLLTYDQNFYMLLRDPRLPNQRQPRPVYHESHTGMLGLMYRVIDVERFFEATSGRNFNRVSMNVGFNVRDSFLRANSGRRVVEFSRGRAILRGKGKKVDLDISLDIGDFSGLIVGACDFRSLWEYGLIEVSDRAYVDRLEKLFEVKRAPVCVTPF